MKVADFGTSRLTDLQQLTPGRKQVFPGRRQASSLSPIAMQQSRTMTSAVGTFLWASPELLGGLPYGLETDVYSFAIVMWEIAERKAPWGDYEMSEIEEVRVHFFVDVAKGVRVYKGAVCVCHEVLVTGLA